MDSISQAALGAAIGLATLGHKKDAPKVAVFGALVATIPDLDVVMLPFLDPLERLSMHRGFSHSIVFSVIGALLLTCLCMKWKWAKQFSVPRLLIFSWLALITHLMLDTFTPYGTLLFLPFSDARVGFDSINIVDPLYTIPLLAGVGFSVFSGKEAFLQKYGNWLGLSISSLYLLGTLFIKCNIETKFESVFESQGIQVTKILSEPVGIGSFHWYALGRTPEGFYIGDYSYLESKEIELMFFDSNDSLLNRIDQHHTHIMKWFAKDFYHIKEHGDSLIFYNMQVDMQGIHYEEDSVAPTRGYFILENKNGGKLIGSGRH